MKKEILLLLGALLSTTVFAEKCPSPDKVINDWHSTEHGNANDWLLSKSSDSPKANSFLEVKYSGQEVFCLYTDPNGTQIGLTRKYPGLISGDWGREKDCKSENPDACQFTVVKG